MVECKDTLGRTISAYFIIGHKSNRIVIIMASLYSPTAEKIQTITLKETRQVVMYSTVLHLRFGVDFETCSQKKLMIHLRMCRRSVLAQTI